MMRTNAMDKDIGGSEFWPFYEEVQRLGIPLALHGGINASSRVHGRFNKFIRIHTVAFPFECKTARIGAGRLLWASDYPHWDTSWPHSVQHFWERKDISEAHKRQIFGENPARLYALEVTAGA